MAAGAGPGLRAASPLSGTVSASTWAVAVVFGCALIGAEIFVPAPWMCGSAYQEVPGLSG